MDKTERLKAVNSVLFISLVVQTVTGLALFFEMFEAQINVFRLIVKAHMYNGILFVLLVGTHIWLNRDWIKYQFFKRS
jgi:cytochrome b subunit of formate dehydrogenase